MHCQVGMTGFVQITAVPSKHAWLCAGKGLVAYSVRVCMCMCGCMYVRMSVPLKHQCFVRRQYSEPSAWADCEMVQSAVAALHRLRSSSFWASASSCTARLKVTTMRLQ